MRLNHRSLYAADGTRIAFGVAGQGPALVLHNGLCTDTSFWRYLWPLWKERYTVITWDYPGHGASDAARSPQGATIEAQAFIVKRLLEVVGVERATHVAFSLGCQVALEVYRQLPSKVNALALLLGPAEHVLSSTRLPVPAPLLTGLFRHLPEPLFAAGFRASSRLAGFDLVLALGRKLELLGTVSNADMADITRHFTMLDPVSMRRMALSAEAHSAFDLLRNVRVPLLIAAGDRDPFAPAASVGLAMHRAARGSTLLRLPRGTHTALLDHAEEIDAALTRLLTGQDSVAA